jgi:branched-subunit amino acid transport protein
MIEASTSQVWIIIIAMGIGTYVIRFSFLGLIGNRELPEWLLKMLRFTPVAVLPGVVAPMLIGSTAAHSSDPLRLSAAMVTLVVGLLTRNVLYAITAGLGMFFGLGALIG